MRTSLDAMRPGTPLPHLLLYKLGWCIVRPALRLFYRAVFLGSARVPAKGPVLLVANHQSYLDPPVVGAAIPHRALDYIARRGLFRNPFMRLIMRPLNCIPIREDGNDPAAMKDILARLAQGRAVLIFPEGSRSVDGSIHTFKRGAAIIVKRARCPVVPVAVEGCFDAWPRHARRPRLLGTRIACAFGRPIDSEQLMRDGGDAAMAELERRVTALRQRLRRLLRKRTLGRFPPHGVADRDALEIPTPDTTAD